MTVPDVITIADGANSCSVCPALGGSITAWSVDGQAMLRPTSDTALLDGNRLGLASFPLVPYSNRIDHGRFTWAGAHYQLAANFPPEPHSLHGTGWEDVWQVDALGAREILLSLVHTADARWPWPFRAEQRISVAGQRLTIVLTAQNLAAAAVPLAFGHHPYFESDGAALQFAADRVWHKDKSGMPFASAPPDGPFDFSRAKPVAGCDLDHGYAGWSGEARIAWRDRPLALEIDTAMTAAVLYIPLNGTAFCFEPVPHIINALNLTAHAPPMPVVAPMACYASTLSLLAVPQR